MNSITVLIIWSSGVHFEVDVYQERMVTLALPVKAAHHRYVELDRGWYADSGMWTNGIERKTSREMLIDGTAQFVDYPSTIGFWHIHDGEEIRVFIGISNEHKRTIMRVKR